MQAREPEHDPGQRDRADHRDHDHREPPVGLPEHKTDRYAERGRGHPTAEHERQCLASVLDRSQRDHVAGDGRVEQAAADRRHHPAAERDRVVRRDPDDQVAEHEHAEREHDRRTAFPA